MEPTVAPGTRIGGYEVVERIGVGGFGEVYRATQPVIGREVAIKILHAKYSTDPVAIARFVSEARAVNQIAHPGIVEIYDFGEHAGRHYMVMELLAGQTLRALLEHRTRLPLAEALPILRAVAEAVDAAHAVGIAHRDLKPDNVFVGETTKLIDFGIAKLGGEAATLTETGSMLGTPQYMSPEQCRGRATDTRTDQYSFGALAYHVLVGEAPFGGDPIEVALHHLNDRPVAPSKRRGDLTLRIDRALLALLAKDPAMRPATCTEAVAALAGARLRTRWSHRSKLAIVSVPILVAGSVVAAIALSGGSEEQPTVSSDCPSSGAKIGGVWSGVIGELVKSRFDKEGDEAHAVGLKTVADVDRFAKEWRERWDRACAMPDRETRPLLYWQRLSCLDNALLDLRAVKETLMGLPVATLVDSGFAGEVSRDRSLEDCGNERVLRVQVPAPREDLRDRLSDLYLHAARARLEAQVAAGYRDTKAFDRALDRLASIARDIEALDAPSAAGWIAERAVMLGRFAFDTDVRRRPAARAALVDAIHRIEASGDAVALADATVGLAEVELMWGDSDMVERATAAAAQAESAVVRAGSPLYATAALQRVRAKLAMFRGRFAEAADLLRQAIATYERIDPELFMLDLHRGLATSLVANGQGDVALAETRRWYEDALRTHDASHQRPRWLRHAYAMVQEATGDVAGALATREILTGLMEDKPPPYAAAWDRLYKLELELRLGKRPADADDAIRKIAGLGTTPPHTNPDGVATARRAGMFAVVSYAADRPGITGDDERLDNAATLAFWRGDRALMTTLAAQAAQRCAKGCSQLRFSRWLALLANPAMLDTGLAALEREYKGDQFAIAYSGIALATVGRWKDARKKLEAARGTPNLWDSQSDLTELDGWLGLARVRDNDFAGARAVFEEALLVMSIYNNSFDGFSYMTPTIELALADILWTQPDSDRPRARRLVEHAIAGFGKLGPGRDTERAAAAKWLAEHPP